MTGSGKTGACAGELDVGTLDGESDILIADKRLLREGLGLMIRSASLEVSCCVVELGRLVRNDRLLLTDLLSSLSAEDLALLSMKDEGSEPCPSADVASS